MARWEFYVGSTHHPCGVIRSRSKTSTGSGSARGQNEQVEVREKADLCFNVLEEQIMSLQAAYENYVAFCKRINVTPATYETWCALAGQ